MMPNSTSGSQPSPGRTAAHPSTAGIAPGNAPTNVHTGDTLFSGVYSPRYVAEVAAVSSAVIQFVVAARYVSPPAIVITPTAAACAALILPIGSGRRDVRRINPSIRRSKTW